MAAPEAQMPFIKNLASSDRHARSQSVESLRTFLSSRTALSPSEARKLWQGLYYAMYMSDRVLSQQALATDLGGLINALPPGVADVWLRGFWGVMARRWTEIDAHRMNKFLLLVRRVLGGALALAKKGGDGNGAEAAVQTLLHGDSDGDQAGPMTVRIDFGVVPVGLRMHVLDIWVDECDKAGLLERGEEEENEVARRIEALVDAVAATSGMAKPIKARARESLEDERLWWRRKAGDGDEDGEAAGGDDDSWDGFED